MKGTIMEKQIPLRKEVLKIENGVIYYKDGTTQLVEKELDKTKKPDTLEK